MGTADGTAHESTPRRRTYFVVTLVVAVIAAYISCRMFVFDWYRIASSDMSPTLQVDDIVFVDKLWYLRREPERSDVIVLRDPDADANLVKRVIGLPGDTIVYDRASRRLTINGAAATLESVGRYDASSEIFRETLGDRSHSILLTQGLQMRGGTYDVPADHYFVLGDHRDNSRDSRFFGFIAREAIIGKVVD
jgi:signal peptidase I